jgi:hypothetical protein
LQIDNDNSNCKGFQEVLQTNNKLDKFIKEEELCITTNYCRLLQSRLEELIKERSLPSSGLQRAEIVEVLQEDNRISQLYYTA